MPYGSVPIGKSEIVQALVLDRMRSQDLQISNHKLCKYSEALFVMTCAVLHHHSFSKNT